MENLFFKIAQKAKKEKELIGVYTDKNDVYKFNVGYVLDVTEENLLLDSIDPNGFKDSLILYNQENIYSIDYSNRYLKNMKLLVNRKQELVKDIPFVFQGNKNERFMNCFMNRCLEDSIFVTVILYFEKCYFGFIDGIDEEVVRMNIISDEGEKDGQTYFRIEDIQNIRLNGLDENRLSLFLAAKK